MGKKQRIKDDSRNIKRRRARVENLIESKRQKQMKSILDKNENNRQAVKRCRENKARSLAQQRYVMLFIFVVTPNIN